MTDQPTSTTEPMPEHVGHSDRYEGWGLHSVADRHDYRPSEWREKWKSGWWKAEWEIFNADVAKRKAMS